MKLGQEGRPGKAKKQSRSENPNVYGSQNKDIINNVEP